MNTVRLNAYAKLNLTLDITGTEGGYHTLDSLVTTVDVFDRVVIRKRKDSLISVTMHGMGSESIPPEENNAQRAGEAFASEFSTGGADITVYKNIPIGAGMGGSSADVSAIIAGMGRLFSIKDVAKLKALADRLGSDTGYLLTGGIARMTGRGEIVEPLAFQKMYFLLIVPRSGVSTRECYAAFDALGCKQSARTEEAVRCFGNNNLGWAARSFGNDLYPAAKTLNPDVERAYLEARSFSPIAAGMTGSGSGVYALFETRELAEWAKSRYRGKFCTIVAESIDPKFIKISQNPFALSEGETEE